MNGEEVARHVKAYWNEISGLGEGCIPTRIAVALTMEYQKELLHGEEEGQSVVQNGHLPRVRWLQVTREETDKRLCRRRMH